MQDDKKYRYFIIPRFNKCYNIEKLANLKISKISAIHSRYLDQKLCIVLIYTHKECTEKEVRNGFENLSTSKTYIKIDEKECKSTRLFFFTNYPSHKNISGVKNLINTFAKSKYQVIPINGDKSNCSYWQIDFFSLNLAKHALNFIPKIPFDGSEIRIFISENPFKIPLVQISGCSNPLSFATKTFKDNEIKFKFISKSFLIPGNNVAYAYLNNVKDSNAFVSNLNYSIYKKERVAVQNFLPLMYASFLSYFEVRVSLKKKKDIRRFYMEMSNIGPVYQVFEYIKNENEENEEEDDDENDLYVIFKNRKALRKIFRSGKFNVSLSNCSIFTLFNFPPNTEETHIQKFLEKDNIKFMSIEKCDSNQNILPHFRIFIEIGEEEQFQSYFNNDKCVYRGKTCPFCVQYLFEDKYEASFEQVINKSNTIQISPDNNNNINSSSNNKKTITDIYNDFSRHGCINFLYFDPEIKRYSITYKNHDAYLSAKKHMEENYPPTKSIVIQKEKAKVIQSGKEEGKKLNFEIKKSSQISLSFLLSSDDDEADDDDSENTEKHSIFASLSSIKFNNPLINSIKGLPARSSYNSVQSPKVKASTIINENEHALRISNNYQNSNKQDFYEDDDDNNDEFKISTKKPKNYNISSKNKQELKSNDRRKLISKKKDIDDKNYSSEDYDDEDEFVFVSQNSSKNQRSATSRQNNRQKEISSESKSGAKKEQSMKKNAKVSNNYQNSSNKSKRAVNDDKSKKIPKSIKEESDESNDDNNDDDFLFIPQGSGISSKISKNRNNSKNSKKSSASNESEEEEANSISQTSNKNVKNQPNITEMSNVEEEDEDDEDDEEDDEFIFVPQVPIKKNKEKSNKKDSSKNAKNKNTKNNNSNGNDNDNGNSASASKHKLPMKKKKNDMDKDTMNLLEKQKSSRVKLNYGNPRISLNNASPSFQDKGNDNGYDFNFGKNLKSIKKQNKKDDIKVSNNNYNEIDDNIYMEDINSIDDIIYVDDDDDSNNSDFGNEDIEGGNEIYTDDNDDNNVDFNDEDDDNDENNVDFNDDGGGFNDDDDDDDDVDENEFDDDDF